MGLDVRAYGRIRRIECDFDEDGDPVDKSTGAAFGDDVIRPSVNPDFPERAEDIEHDAVYGYANAEGMTAGSYDGYGLWREKLAQLAGYPKEAFQLDGKPVESHCVACWNGTEGPFSELIDFSDCEGTIGTRVSGKLAADFAAFQKKVDAEADERFAKRYRDWRTAFETAADGGCVVFR